MAGKAIIRRNKRARGRHTMRGGRKLLFINFGENKTIWLRYRILLGSRGSKVSSLLPAKHTSRGRSYRSLKSWRTLANMWLKFGGKLFFLLLLASLFCQLFGFIAPTSWRQNCISHFEFRGFDPTSSKRRRKMRNEFPRFLFDWNWVVFLSRESPSTRPRHFRCFICKFPIEMTFLTSYQKRKKHRKEKDR